MAWCGAQCLSGKERVGGQVMVCLRQLAGSEGGVGHQLESGRDVSRLDEQSTGEGRILRRYDLADCARQLGALGVAHCDCTGSGGRSVAFRGVSDLALGDQDVSGDNDVIDGDLENRGQRRSIQRSVRHANGVDDCLPGGGGGVGIHCLPSPFQLLPRE